MMAEHLRNSWFLGPALEAAGGRAGGLTYFASSLISDVAARTLTAPSPA